jgi:SAM-dependent methyltransferase
MTLADRERWDAKYSGISLPAGLRPSPWLMETVAELRPGRALELACGLGHNAIWLSKQGWTVDAVDVSPVGIEHARRFAKEQGAEVGWIAADIDDFRPEPDTYDLVAVFRFLDREHLPAIVLSALRPGGRLIYETFSAAQLERPDTHIRNPAFVFAPGEAPRLLQRLETLYYEELELPEASVVRFVGRK